MCDGGLIHEIQKANNYVIIKEIVQFKNKGRTVRDIFQKEWPTSTCKITKLP